MTPTKAYVGDVTPPDMDWTVFVHEAGQQARPLEHHVRHSPDGFSWGYHGSGPSDLALSLLWDALGAEPLPHVYHQFKVDVLGGLDMDAPFTIFDHEVAAWFNAAFPNQVVAVPEHERVRP